MLREAAPENDRLADYYERVTRRVKGHGDEAEQNDGVGVAMAVRPPSRSSAVRSQVSSQGLVGVAQAASLAQPAAEPSIPSKPISALVKRPPALSL